MEKLYSLSERAENVKKLLAMRENDFNDIHEYFTRQFERLRAQLDDTRVYLVKLDKATIAMMMANSEEEVELITESFVEDLYGLD